MAYKSERQIKQETTKDGLLVDETTKYYTLEYPGDLGGPSKPHFMMFYINANSRAILNVKDSRLKTNDLDTRTDRKFDGVDVGSTSAEIQAKVPSNKVTELVGVGLPRKRMNLAIALPIPDALNQNFNAGYSNVEIGALGSILLDAASGQFEGAAAGTADYLAGKLIKEIAKSKDGKGDRELGQTLDKLKSKITGAVVNTRQEMIFEKMKLRTFNFTWTLAPRNREEHDAILNIIRAFKEHMHPGFMPSAQGASMLITPSEWDIEFRYGEAENNSIGKIATCALSGFAVNYTSGGKFVAVSGTDKPLCISIAAEFVEMEPIISQMVRDKGF